MVQDGTVSYLIADKQVIAAVVQSDSLRDTAKDFVKQLLKQGITPVLVTGDNIKTAQAVANQLT
ncbi:hypothetical protein Q604_UNBc4C00066G0002, partial [human gut metagenome]